MMRITLDSPALIAVRNWLAGLQPTQRSRGGRRTASRAKFRAEQLEKRTMLDAAAISLATMPATDVATMSAGAEAPQTAIRSCIIASQ